jgi:hypothetical protein
MVKLVGARGEERRGRGGGEGKEGRRGGKERKEEEGWKFGSLSKPWRRAADHFLGELQECNF